MSDNATPDSVDSPTTRTNSQSIFDQRDKQLAIQIEQRILNVIRRESQDPYAGLPADDVLDRLDRRFPDVHFAERMMSRVELEQRHRHEIQQTEALTVKFEAETRRLNGQEDRAMQTSAAKRAERVLYVLLAIGLILVFAGHETPGGIVLGTSLVGIVGAFLAQRVSGGKR